MPGDDRLLYYDRNTGEYLNNLQEERAARQAAEAEVSAERTARLAADAEAERLREEIRRLRGRIDSCAPAYGSETD